MKKIIVMSLAGLILFLSLQAEGKDKVKYTVVGKDGKTYEHKIKVKDAKKNKEQYGSLSQNSQYQQGDWDVYPQYQQQYEGGYYQNSSQTSPYYDHQQRFYPPQSGIGYYQDQNRAYYNPYQQGYYPDQAYSYYQYPQYPQYANDAESHTHSVSAPQKQVSGGTLTSNESQNIDKLIKAVIDNKERRDLREIKTVLSNPKSSTESRKAQRRRLYEIFANNSSFLRSNNREAGINNAADRNANLSYAELFEKGENKPNSSFSERLLTSDESQNIDTLIKVVIDNRERRELREIKAVLSDSKSSAENRKAQRQRLYEIFANNSSFLRSNNKRTGMNNTADRGVNLSYAELFKEDNNNPGSINRTQSVNQENSNIRVSSSLVPYVNSNRSLSEKMGTGLIQSTNSANRSVASVNNNRRFLISVPIENAELLKTVRNYEQKFKAGDAIVQLRSSNPKVLKFVITPEVVRQVLNDSAVSGNLKREIQQIALDTQHQKAIQNANADNPD